jgi:hypothetical protein
MYTNPADFLFMTVLNTEGSTRAKVQRLTNGGDEGDDSRKRATSTATATDDENDEAEGKRIKNLLDLWHQTDRSKQLLSQISNQRQSGQQTAQDLAKSVKYRADLATQFNYLFGRAWRNAVRNKFIVKVRFAQSLFIALLVGLIYLNTPSKTLNQQIQVQNNNNFLIISNYYLLKTRTIRITPVQYSSFV